MFRRVQTSDDLTRVIMIRAIVFMEEQGISCADEMDGHDHCALHVLGEVDGEPVACGRIRFLPEGARLQRLAVRRAWRGQGIRRALLQHCEARLRQIAAEQSMKGPVVLAVSWGFASGAPTGGR